MNAFQQLGLQEQIVESITKLGFTEPTPIQQKAIPVLLEQTTDFVGLAQTGTGKTAAFGLPLIQHVDINIRDVQALILSPTRELCLQISLDLEKFSSGVKGIKVVPVYGGTFIGAQIRSLKQGANVVAATPGRLIDLIERKAIDLEKVQYIVLDEADEMLNMGFRDDIDFILKNTPNRKSIWLFSATMSPEVRNISKRFMNNPAEISVAPANTTNTNIDHQYFVTHANQRFSTLKRILDFNPEIYGLVFTRTKLDAQDIAEKLIKEGYNSDALHGDLTQAQRDKVMERFRNRSLQLLIATDVAARGIDVKDITHVINYELPDDPEVYTHRSGRTARAGRSGICISLLHTREVSKIRTIERIAKAKFSRMDIPSGSEVCRKQFFHFTDKLLNVQADHEEFETYLPTLQEKFADISKEELIKKMAALEFDRFFESYKDAEDLNVYSNAGAGAGNKRSDTSETLFINVGTTDGVDKGGFLQFIHEMTEVGSDLIGKIVLRETFTFFEVDKACVPIIFEGIKDKKMKGRKLRVDVAERKLSDSPRGGGGGGSRFGGGGRDRGGDSGGFRRRDSNSGGGGSRFGGGDRKPSYKRGRSED